MRPDTARRLLASLLALPGAVMTVAFAAVVMLDFAVGMPAFWSWGEGPPTVLVGVVDVWLARSAR